MACRVVWNGDTVVRLEPFALGAFNDRSIRRPGAPKISYKKNWGPASKGVAPQFFEINDLTPDGPTATMRLVCYLSEDGGQQHAYGGGFSRWSAIRTTARCCWTGSSNGWPTRRVRPTPRWRMSAP